MFLNIIQGPQQVPNTDMICSLSWLALPDLGNAHPAGTVQNGALIEATLVFALTRTPVADALISEEIVEPNGPALLRVDEVCFPVGAIAHNHTHAGAGFRYLARGSLRLEAEGHTQTLTAGDSWFEAAMSPVRAVALQTTGVTSFVRCMVVPLEFEGVSTFKLVDPVDANLPRLQLTHRHIDHRFEALAG